MRPLILHQGNLLQHIEDLKNTVDPSHCKGVLIPSPSGYLGTIVQRVWIHNQTDRRQTEASLFGNKHNHCQTAIPDPRMCEGLSFNVLEAS